MSKARILYQSDHFRATLFAADTRLLIVTFDHWKRGKSDFGASNHAKFWARTGVSQLSLKTKRNDWFVNPETARLEDTIRSVTRRFDRVHALGFSMGAYAALRLGRAIYAQRAVLVSPQFSVWPKHAPESQWCKRYEGTSEAPDGALGTHGHHAQAGDLIYDPFDPEDAYHADLCRAVFPNLVPVRLPFAGHPSHQVLANSGKFRVFQKAAMAETSSRRDILTKYKRVRRTSDRYRRNLTSYLTAKGRLAPGQNPLSP